MSERKRRISAGRKLDAMVLKALGFEVEHRDTPNVRRSLWRIHRYEHTGGTGARATREIAPRCSTSFDGAAEVVEAMRERGLFLMLTDMRQERAGDFYTAAFQSTVELEGEGDAPTIPHAISLAALDALRRRSRFALLTESAALRMARGEGR